jgi:diguanylate cyclase (GGDEF)-like protein
MSFGAAVHALARWARACMTCAGRAGQRLRAARIVLICALGPHAAVLAQSVAPPLQLDDAVSSVPAWPAVRQWVDADGSLALPDVLRLLPRFTPPTTATNTLGQRRDVVWLHLPLEVDGQSDGRWLLDIDYAMLNRVDAWLLDADGRLQQQARMGSTVRFADRPLQTRSHAWALQLRPGERRQLLLRVQTRGGMIVPITLNKPQAFWQRAQSEQMLQGLLTGLGLCLLLYSLAQWVTLREPLFGKYMLLIGSGLVFSFAQFGIGAQYLWPGQTWLDQYLPAMAALSASAGAALFFDAALEQVARPAWFSRAMQGLAVVLLAGALLFALDVIDVMAVSLIVGTLGLLPALMAAPLAWRLVRRGDPLGLVFLVAWLGYFAAAFISVLVIKGRLPANFWTLHAFQFFCTLDMVLFLRVLGLRLRAVHAAARQAASEAETLRSLALTDPLTGLPNRRGLHNALQAALPHSSLERPLALYMLDLDGFKLVNDGHGHDVGDLLLAAVADRLREKRRELDVVARLGGDEFIVMVRDLKSEEHAHALGQQMVEDLRAPFHIQGRIHHVGCSAGYVLAPRDGRQASELLQLADRAMYRAKQDGKGRVLAGVRAAV